MIQIHAQLDGGISMSTALIGSQVRMKAQAQPVTGIDSGLFPRISLSAALAPSIPLSAVIYLDGWADEITSNLITADGYHIETADGYLLCVKDK